MKNMIDRYKYLKFYLSIWIGLCMMPTAYADFMKDSKASVNLRNFFIERDFQHLPNKSIGTGCFRSF